MAISLRLWCSLTSRHDWLEDRGPWLTLVGAIDDATGLVVGAIFRDQEDAAGYLHVLRDVVSQYGIPGAIYRDGQSAFVVTSPRRADPEDLGPANLTQVGRPLAELDIASIAAASPQAKGPIERLWRTCQDRLVVELRLAGVVDRDGANAFLAGFIARHNARFKVPAVDPIAAWRALPAEIDLKRVFVFKYRRKVARDHTIRLGGGSSSCRASRPVRPTMRARSSRSTWPSTDRSWRSTKPAAGNPPGARRSGSTPDAQRAARRTQPQPRSRHHPLDPASGSPLEAGTIRQQARPATDRFTRQLI